MIDDMLSNFVPLLDSYYFPLRMFFGSRDITHDNSLT
jgi:hypothetical protein